ncbi:MAG: response regulator transcription factor, partial [Planctomycetales bacterium]|nr:response regulator transcription factor [Planctomycetales bacterium]
MNHENIRPTVVLVDDDYAIAECVARCLNHMAEVEVVAVGRHAQAAVALAAAHRPAVVLMDIHMPGVDAFWACQEILTQTRQETRVLFYTGFPRDHYLDRALAAGASGMVSKHSESMQALCTAIRHVANGGTYYSPELASRFVQLENEAPRSRVTTLAHREIEVLRLLALGRTNREIGDELGISLRSVEKEVSDMKQKLGLNSTNELLIFAAREELIYPELLMTPANGAEPVEAGA